MKKKETYNKNLVVIIAAVAAIIFVVGATWSGPPNYCRKPAHPNPAKQHKRHSSPPLRLETKFFPVFYRLIVL